MKKITILAVATIMTATLLSAQQPPAKSDTAKAADNPVVVTAGNIKITQSELEAAIRTLPDQYQGYAMGPGRRAFAEDYLRMKLLAAEAAKNHLDQKPDVARQLELMRNNTLANAQISKMRDALEVSDEEIQKAYDAKKDSYEQAKARHILIAFEGSPAAPKEGALTEEAAKKKAEELRQQIINGADFAELAKKESDDKGSGANGGDLGTFGRGRMVPEFEKAVFEGKVGDVLPVVRTQFGYHIIQVQDRTLVPFDQVKDQLKDDAIQEKLQAEVEKLEKTAGASFDDQYFAEAAAAGANPHDQIQMPPAPEGSQP